MATGKTLRLRAIRPVDRVYVSKGPSGRRERKHAKHTRHGMWADGTMVIFHTTQRTPWSLRARRRLHERIAKASRRANRRRR